MQFFFYFFIFHPMWQRYLYLKVHLSPKQNSVLDEPWILWSYNSVWWISTLACSFQGWPAGESSLLALWSHLYRISWRTPVQRAAVCPQAKCVSKSWRQAVHWKKAGEFLAVVNLNLQSSGWIQSPACGLPPVQRVFPTVVSSAFSLQPSWPSFTIV